MIVGSTTIAGRRKTVYWAQKNDFQFVKSRFQTELDRSLGQYHGLVDPRLTHNKPSKQGLQ